jgi:hypothetical protein
VSLFARLAAANPSIVKGSPDPAPPSPGLGLALIDSLGFTATAGRIDPAQGFRGSPVQWSEDLDRIVALPRRHLDVTDPAAAAAWTDHLRLPDSGPCDCVERWGFCIRALRAIQGWGLEEAAEAGGFLGPIGVGHGKEGLCLLAPWAFESKVAVLMLPANLRAQFLTRDYPQWSRHFRVPSLAGGTFWPGRPVLHVMSYNDLSSPKATNLLRQIGPDLVILNEAQNLARREAARTKRFLRYVSEARQAGRTVRLFATSGTLSKRSIKDYAHSSAIALGEGSPLPLHWPTVEEWAGAVDATDFPAPVGQLRRLCNDGETARAGFRRRLRDTRGVVATDESALDTLLTITERRTIRTPPAVEKMLDEVRDTWQRPDGEEIVDAITKAAVCRQLAAGFFYRWRWPRQEPKPVIDAWLAARKEWHKEIREKLKIAREHLDSPLLVTKAAIRWHDGYVWVNPETGERREIPPHTRAGPLPTWDAYAWPDWRRLRDTAHPETEAVWVDDFAVRDAAEWASAEPGIVWYEHACVGPKIAKLAGIPHYGGGADASNEILGERGKRSIVASIRAHGTGKNLQCFARNLVVNPPADGATWEQLLARTHRPGQLADEVVCEVYRHTAEMREAIDTAIVRARYISETGIGGVQKLLYATIDFEPDPAPVTRAASYGEAREVLWQRPF